MDAYKKETTSHILTSSANLIGVCLIIITGLRISNMAKSTILDEVAAIAASLFLLSGMYAYLSMRQNASAILRHRDIADYTFLSGLTLLVITVVLISFNLIT
ncbi:hypothetical protein HKL94_00730 [Candidatus Parcubacteria bacterium]|nr:hypothetical protein [Candidatus Parcubacteria bacterium]